MRTYAYLLAETRLKSGRRVTDMGERGRTWWKPEVLLNQQRLAERDAEPPPDAAEDIGANCC
eukprot:SAG11_NODE_10152_length_851_cov_1.163564_2_plen_61_part_01